MFSFKSFLKILIMIPIFSSTNALPAPVAEFNIQNSTQQISALTHLITQCKNLSSASTVSSAWQCFKVKSLNIIDGITRRKIISLWPGIRFVQSSGEKENLISLKIYQNDLWQRKDLQYLTWFDRLALSFTKMLRTHTLEINLKELTEAYMDNARRKDSSLSDNTEAVGTARHRRHRFNMMVTMIFGVTALGAVLIPMGFQMLSIVSGKALLLAKMALLLASINGLKRVANSGVHYGLYQVPGEHYGHPYDRGDIHHPRNVQNLIPIVAQPPEVELAV